jgi:hypothetical protein
MLYVPLLTHEIRLITIQPSGSPHDPVHCQLDHYDFTERAYTDEYAASLREASNLHGTSSAEDQRKQSSRIDSQIIDLQNAAPATSNLPDFRYAWGDYLALSYTWGDLTSTCTVYVNGGIMTVTENLEAALKAFRSQPYIRAGWKIWIDALCINQKDPVERATQVKRMGEVYRKAWTPVVWLGATSVDSDQAIELIHDLAKDHDVPDQVIKLNRILKRNSKAFGEGSWQALHDFALRRYWTRTWIVQEASLGRANMPVLCGDQTLRWTDIHHAFRFLGRTDEILNKYMKAELAEVGRPVNLAIHRAIGVVSKIGRYQQEIEAGSRSFDLSRVMSFSRQVSATDPRDKVYGLLALMDPEMVRRIHPDYTASVEEVYVDFAKLTIDVSQTLENLRHIAPADSLPLPSWVPDWTSEQQLCSLGDIPHRACGNTLAQVSYSMHGVLSCRGFIVDTLDGMGCVWRDTYSNGWPPSTVRQPSSSQNPYGELDRVREAIWRTMVANRNVYAKTLQEDYSSLLAVPAIFEARGRLGNEDLEDIAASELLSYCVRFFQGNADFMVAGDRLSSYFISEPSFAQLNSSTLRNALAARDKINLYRRLLTTSQGLLGIGSQTVLPGDLVCILFGCSMPIVLRGVDGGFQVIGECYVHGLMDGEGLELLQQQGLVIRDFNIR